MATPAATDIARWYEETTREPVSPVRLLRLAEILEGAGLDLGQVHLVVNADRRWGTRPGPERWPLGVSESRYYWLVRKEAA